MKLKHWSATAVVLLMLGACEGTSYLPQENWVANMSAAYPAGTPAADVEASVTAAGMTFEEVPNAFRILPRSATTDGSGYWRRVVAFDEAVGCTMRRQMYFRFDDGDQLMRTYPGGTSCV